LTGDRRIVAFGLSALMIAAYSVNLDRRWILHLASWMPVAYRAPDKSIFYLFEIKEKIPFFRDAGLP
jgi:hypothetical protein